MKALTLTQPWASAVARGVKRIETRSWSTGYRGWLAIHAAKGWEVADREFALEEVYRFLEMYPEDYPRAAVVAIVRLVDVQPVEKLPRVSDVEYLLGDYGEGRYGWVLDEVTQLAKPVPAVGKLGLWQLPADVLAECQRQVYGATFGSAARAVSR